MELSRVRFVREPLNFLIIVVLLAILQRQRIHISLNARQNSCHFFFKKKAHSIGVRSSRLSV
jgi:hypothetical protein